MRLSFAVALLLVFTPPLYADEDDPKMTRPPALAPAPPSLPPPASLSRRDDEDDPKLGRPTPAPRRWWQPSHDVPRFKLTYRYLDLAGLAGGTQHFDAVGLSVYPLSSLVRLGIDGEFAWGGGPYQMWLATVGLVAGLQYPARVTPFLDGRFVAGVVGGTVMSTTAVSWLYAGGLETGVEIYYARRYYLTLAVGWMHPVYGGIDVNAAMKNGALIMRNFANDTLTFKVGLGL
jgi:hypothetical protein